MHSVSRSLRNMHSVSQSPMQSCRSLHSLSIYSACQGRSLRRFLSFHYLIFFSVFKFVLRFKGGNSWILQNSKMADQDAETTATATNNATDTHLDDDKHPKEDNFVGATLEISGDGVARQPEVEFAGPTLDRNRPGSTMSRRSVRSTTSKTSMKPAGYKSDKSCETFFSYKVVVMKFVVGNSKIIVVLVCKSVKCYRIWKMDWSVSELYLSI